MSWTLNLGDCLDPVTGLASLSDGVAAHVITDPPYSERVHRGKGAERRSDGGNIENLDFAHLRESDQDNLAAHFARISQRWILIFCDDMNLYHWAQAVQRHGAEYAVKGTWIKEAPMPRMDGTRPAYGTEEIVVAHAFRESGKTRWNGGGRAALYKANSQEDNRNHPTQKPLSLMEALIRDFTDPSDLILDPFAGSGTTGVAAIRLGRNFIGWERDPKYHAIAMKRLASAKEQINIFSRPMSKPKQLKLMGGADVKEESKEDEASGLPDHRPGAEGDAGQASGDGPEGGEADDGDREGVDREGDPESPFEETEDHTEEGEEFGAEDRGW